MDLEHGLSIFPGVVSFIKGLDEGSPSWSDTTTLSSASCTCSITSHTRLKYILVLGGFVIDVFVKLMLIFIILNHIKKI